MDKSENLANFMKKMGFNLPKTKKPQAFIEKGIFAKMYAL